MIGVANGECGVFDTVYEGIERGAIKKDRREVRVKTLMPSDVRTCPRGHVTSEYLTPFHRCALPVSRTSVPFHA